MNAFMIWSSRKRRELARQHPKLHNSQISKILGSEWRKLTEEEKQKFFAQAKLLSELHLIEHPDYKYRPKRRVKKKHIKHKPESGSHGCSALGSCYCSEGSCSSQLTDLHTLQEDEGAQQLNGSEAMKDDAIFIKNEQPESLTAAESIPTKSQNRNPDLGRHSNSLQSKASKSLFSLKYGSRNISSVGSRGEIFEESLRFREDHLVALRQPPVPSYYPSDLHTAHYRQPQCHLLPNHFVGERDAAGQFLPPATYSAARCHCCHPESITNEEEFPVPHGSQYPFLNTRPSQYFYGRRW